MQDTSASLGVGNNESVLQYAVGEYRIQVEPLAVRGFQK